jgi:hypothetical protein
MPVPARPAYTRPPIWRIISQQQRAEVRSSAFRVGPAGDDEFFAIEALELQPSALAIARPVRRVNAFRDNAFSLELTCLAEEVCATADYVFAILQAGGRTFHNFG